jgi:hypothetical protein
MEFQQNTDLQLNLSKRSGVETVEDVEDVEVRANALFALVTNHSRIFTSRRWAAADSRKDLIVVD